MVATTDRPSTTIAIAQASGQGTASKPADGCKDCKKVGLAILPVVPTPVPNSLKGKTTEISSLEKLLNAADLKEHWYAMRTLPSGYLYVLKPDLTWDGYLVDNDGLLRMMPTGAMPANPGDQPAMSEACKRSADNIPAQVIAVDPKKHSVVWLAFSRYRWTPAVLKDYAANKNGCRDQRMSKLDVEAAAAGSLGSNSTAKNAVKFGAKMDANIGNRVADYSSSATRELFNKEIALPLRGRGEQVKSLVEQMAKISKDTAGKTGAVICLFDELGVAMDLNTMRNAETGRMGAYMLQNQRKRMVGDIILGFEEAYTKNGQGKQWNERYITKYKSADVKKDKAAYDGKIKDWNKKLSGSSADVTTLNGNGRLKAYWRDFDPTDDQSAKDRQHATACCLTGTVKTKEDEALWDSWFNEDPSDPYATLWGAVTALNADFAAFMVGKSLPDAGKTDKFVDIAKNIREVGILYRENLAKRSADDAMGLIGLAMASQVSRLKIVNPALYKVAGARVLMSVSARTSVTAAPGFMAVTQSQEAFMMAEAAFGPPEPRLKRLLDIETKTSARTYVVASNGVDIYASNTATVQKTRVVELWLPESLAKDLPALAAPNPKLLLPAPKINPYQGLVKFSKSLPGAFAWAGLTLQALNLGNSVKDWKDSKVDDKSDAYFGMASGVLGVAGVTAEIAAGTMGKMATRFAVTSIAKVAFAGGMLAGFSAIAESFQAFYRASDRNAAGDTDARDMYLGAGVTLFISGGLGIAGSLAIASSAGALTGAFGFLAGIGTAATAIPVAGWIAAAVIFLGIGLALLWQAIKNTDTPLEVWLLGSVYGTGKVQFNNAQELEQLNELMYAMTIEVEWSDDAWEWRNTEFYDDYDNFRFGISLPGAGADSVIDCKVTIIGTQGRKLVFNETIRPRMAGANVIDPHMATMSAAPPRSAKPETPKFVWWEAPRISTKDGVLRYGGQLKLNDDHFSSAEVEISYWPDQKTMPNFVLPKKIDQRTLVAGD